MPEITFNSELWEKGFAQNCHISANTLLSEGAALYVSSSIDSFENGTSWNRLTLSFAGGADARCKLSYFATDYKTVYTRGELIDINSIIASKANSANEKRELLKGLWADTAQNPPDIPLCYAKGRYLWFMLEFDAPPGCPPLAIERLRIVFGRDSWTEYLPEIYRLGESGFLTRFLGLFESVYSDLDKEIAGISSILDVDSADGERLAWLSGWVAAGGFSSWPAERLKELIKNARALSEIKGTRECLSRAVELYTGGKPLIVETAEALLYGHNELYGKDIYSFTVIIGEECLWGDANSFAAGLSRLISYYSPIHTRAKTAVLRQFIVLGLHTYLGINTRLASRESLILGGKATADFGMVV